MNDTVKNWLVGVGGEIIKGAASSVVSFGAVILSDFAKFNLIAIGISALVGGIIGGAIFLKGKPLPWTPAE